MIVRDEKYLDWIRDKHCCLCGYPPRSTAHHCGNGVDNRRSRDDIAVPLCGKCHTNVHAYPAKYKMLMRKLANKFRFAYESGEE